MPEDNAGEKTEQPTARRREEAREEGQVPRSTDLTAAVALLMGLVLLAVFGSSIYEHMQRLMRDMLGTPEAQVGQVPAWVARTLRSLAAMLLPFLVLLVICTGAAGWLQTGLLVVPKKLKPRLENISPAKGLKRLFSLDSVTRTLMGLLKMACVGLVACVTIADRLVPVLGAGTVPAAGVLSMSAELLFALMVRMALVLLVLGLLDYFYQRYRVEQQLKMSKQEIRDELKRMEGDPLIKNRRRAAQQKLAMQRIAVDVPKADVVVTNPTEYAVALRYDEKTMRAPRVLAKGKDLLALRIRQVAREHGVPVVQRPPLARGLYATCEVGDEVPPQYYRAVAEVLAYVYQLAGRAAG